MRILITGVRGQLGQSLLQKIERLDHEVFALTRQQLDLGSREGIREMVTRLNPEIVINSAAFTGVDKAESDIENAKLVNQTGVKILAQTCAAIDALLIHLSTDYVFDGLAKAPYTENDQTNPQGVYGTTKLIGERHIEDSGCRFIVIRTSWLYSEFGENFLKTMIRLSRHGKPLRVVSDQLGSPTYAPHLAQAIVKIASVPITNMDSGVYHFCSDSVCSWYDFAKLIFAKCHEISGGGLQKVIAVTTEEYPTAAVRPKYSVLSCKKIKEKFGVRLSSLDQGITRSLQIVLRQEQSI